MGSILGALAGLAAVACVVWLVWPSPSEHAANQPDEVLDAENARQVGYLIGLMGGSVADAAIAKLALERFEELHGRKATMRDAGTVAGLMRSGR